MARFSALVVDPLPEGRKRIEEALRSFRVFSTLKLSKAIIPNIDAGSFDIAFIAVRSDFDEARAELRRLKELGIVTVLVLPQGVNARVVTAASIDRVDAILVEPYTLDSLHDAIKLIGKVREAEHRTKVRRSLDCLAVEIRALHSFIARMRRRNHSARVAHVVLCEIGSLVREFEPELQSAYLNALVEEYVRGHELAPSNHYSGLCQRIYSRATRRAATELQRVLNG